MPNSNEQSAGQQPSPIPEYCVTCRYWVLDVDDKTGTCHRRAPTRNLECTKACFVPTEPLMWCGEYQVAAQAELCKRKAVLHVPPPITVPPLDLDLSMVK